MEFDYYNFLLDIGLENLIFILNVIHKEFKSLFKNTNIGMLLKIS